MQGESKSMQGESRSMQGESRSMLGESRSMLGANKKYAGRTMSLIAPTLRALVDNVLAGLLRKPTLLCPARPRCNHPGTNLPHDLQ